MAVFLPVAAVLAGLCLSGGGTQRFISADRFELGWMHSIEKTNWNEFWRVVNNELVLDWASVQTSGAGMDIPENAVFRDGAYYYRVDRNLSELRLFQVSSPFEYRLCVNSSCKSIESWLGFSSLEGEILVKPCLQP